MARGRLTLACSFAPELSSRTFVKPHRAVVRKLSKPLFSTYSALQTVLNKSEKQLYEVCPPAADLQGHVLSVLRVQASWGCRVVGLGESFGSRVSDAGFSIAFAGFRGCLKLRSTVGSLDFG